MHAQALERYKEDVPLYLKMLNVVSAVGAINHAKEV